MIGFFAITANVGVDTSEILHAWACCQVFCSSFVSECSSPSLSSVFDCVGWCISPPSGGLLRYLQFFKKDICRDRQRRNCGLTSVRSRRRCCSSQVCRKLVRKYVSSPLNNSVSMKDQSSVVHDFGICACSKFKSF